MMPHANYGSGFQEAPEFLSLADTPVTEERISDANAVVIVQKGGFHQCMGSMHQPEWQSPMQVVVIRNHWDDGDMDGVPPFLLRTEDVADCFDGVHCDFLSRMSDSILFRSHHSRQRPPVASSSLI